MRILRFAGIDYHGDAELTLLADARNFSFLQANETLHQSELVNKCHIVATTLISLELAVQRGARPDIRAILLVTQHPVQRSHVDVHLLVLLPKLQGRVVNHLHHVRDELEQCVSRTALDACVVHGRSVLRQGQEPSQVLATH